MAELPRRRTHALVLEPCPEVASRLIKTCFQTTRTLYLAVVLDLFTRKIVGWAMRDHMRAELTIAALTMAIQRQKPPPGLTHYSDRGSQYAAADYRKVLDAAGMIQFMSRKGNCWDNAAMEGCFGTLKTELVHQACYPTRDAARHDLFAYIEGYYNRQRLHFTLEYITPEEAERQAAYASVHQIGGRSTRSHAQDFTSSMQLSPDEISAA